MMATPAQASEVHFLRVVIWIWKKRDEAQPEVLFHFHGEERAAQSENILMYHIILMTQLSLNVWTSSKPDFWSIYTDGWTRQKEKHSIIMLHSLVTTVTFVSTFIGVMECWVQTPL